MALLISFSYVKMYIEFHFKVTVSLVLIPKNKNRQSRVRKISSSKSLVRETCLNTKHLTADKPLIPLIVVHGKY